MFTVKMELMKSIKQALNVSRVPAYCGVAYSATCSTCRGTCKGICSESCSLGCKHGCTRASGR